MLVPSAELKLAPLFYPCDVVSWPMPKNVPFQILQRRAQYTRRCVFLMLVNKKPVQLSIYNEDRLILKRQQREMRVWIRKRANIFNKWLSPTQVDVECSSHYAGSCKWLKRRKRTVSRGREIWSRDGWMYVVAFRSKKVMMRAGSWIPKHFRETELASASIFQKQHAKKPKWSSLCRERAALGYATWKFLFFFWIFPKKTHHTKTKEEELKIRVSFVYHDHVTKMSPPNPTKLYKLCCC